MKTAALELVVAAAENDVIGRDNRLPWRLPADLRRFKALTLGRVVLMGRKTYESIGKALPGRTNLILTRSLEFAAADCAVVGTLEDALRVAAHCSVPGALDEARRLADAPLPLMVIGGADVYRQCLSLASRIHLTLVHTRVEDGDTFFGGWRGAEWRETLRERHEADDKNSHAYSFVTLERRPAEPSAATAG